MSRTEVVPIRLSQTERRQRVAFGVKVGKSNRALGKELGVDEGTVRRDRKYLATPEDERHVRVPRPKKERSVRELSPCESHRRHKQSLLKAAQLWITQERMLLPHIENVLDEAGKLLYLHRFDLRGIPISTKSPSELLVLTRPSEVVEDYMPARLPFYARWLARWLACCLPRDEKLRDEVLHEISKWAQSSPWRFVY